MEIIDSKVDLKEIHFIGIGGISMSALAEILHNKGYLVTGSDTKDSKLIHHLQKIGIKVFIGQQAENISETVDLVVYTAAVKADNPELLAAREKKIQVIDRAYLLGVMMKDYQYPVCVSGTHGKTTTTGMVSEIFLAADKNPTITLGGILPSINGNFYLGGDDYFIVESCEYFDSFLKFHPYIGIILNVESDHLDYFKDLHHIQDSFHKFAGNIAEQGVLVINKNIDDMENIIEGLACNVVTYGKEDADWYAEHICYDENGYGRFDLIHQGKTLAEINLKVRGAHNISNALAACAAAYALEVSIDDIKRGLESFGGPCRRYEVKGKINGITIVDDYAHHPTEIKATILAAKNSNHNNLWCVFQPHTFSRTKLLLNELAEAFELADKVVILDIYSAREKDNREIHSKDLVDKIKLLGKEVYYFASFDEAEIFLFDRCIHGDLLITMGAGDVYLLGEKMLRTELSTLSTKIS